MIHLTNDQRKRIYPKVEGEVEKDYRDYPVYGAAQVKVKIRIIKDGFVVLKPFLKDYSEYGAALVWADFYEKIHICPALFLR